MGTIPNLFNKKWTLIRQFLHTICCDNHCNTNQLGKITNNVKNYCPSELKIYVCFFYNISQQWILFNVHKMSKKIKNKKYLFKWSTLGFTMCTHL